MLRATRRRQADISLRLRLLLLREKRLLFFLSGLFVLGKQKEEEISLTLSLSLSLKNRPPLVGVSSSKVVFFFSLAVVVVVYVVVVVREQKKRRLVGLVGSLRGWSSVLFCAGRVTNAKRF